MSPDDDSSWEAISRRIAEVEAATLKRLQSSPAPVGALDPATLRMIEDVNAIVGATRRLTADLGRAPTDTEIAEETGLSVDYVARCTQTCPKPIDLDGA